LTTLRPRRTEAPADGETADGESADPPAPVGLANLTGRGCSVAVVLIALLNPDI
jgi:hypothetical protein